MLLSNRELPVKEKVTDLTNAPYFNICSSWVDAKTCLFVKFIW